MHLHASMILHLALSIQGSLCVIASEPVVQLTRITADEAFTIMTTAQFIQLDTDEATQVLRWRLNRLTAAGYDLDDAVVLASNVEIDLHDAAELVRRGCPSATAVRILL